MTAPWWGKDAIDARPVGERLEATADPASTGVRRPVVFPADAEALADELRARRSAFTPSWTSLDNDDPGMVAIDLIAAQIALAAREIDDLPTKIRADVLDTAGISALGPVAMTTLLAFEISPNATAPVTIGARFAAIGTDVDGRQVRFETDRSIMAAPATLAAAATASDGVLQPLELPELDKDAAIRPFGARPKLGDAFYLGLECPFSPGPRLALAVFAPERDTPPAPVAFGGLAPLPAVATPVLDWEVFDGREWTRAEVLRDKSESFARTGAIELQVGRRWPAAVVVDGRPALRWLRATLVRGRYDVPPALAGIAINAVPATAGETRRDEVLEPIAEPGRRPSQFRLARGGVIPDSLLLVVDEGAAEAIAWHRVDDLAASDPDDRHYVLEPAGGVVRFGDGAHGRPVPDGFRHVRALEYRVVTASARIEPDAVTRAVGNAAFVVGVTNPRAPGGQRPAETLLEVLRRGPGELRARGRAVNPADYEVCALRAGIRRARAFPGYHPLLPGREIPGVVGVLVVPEPRDDGKPPIPDEATLRQVARYLAAEAAPAGVEIVAAAPRFQRVSVEADVVIRRGGDVGAAIAAVLESLDTYLDPLRGGDDGDGWPFGGAIRHTALARRLLERVPALLAVPRLNLVLDDLRSSGCRDIPIAPRALLWPAGHEIFPEEGEP